MQMVLTESTSFSLCVYDQICISIS